MHRGGSYVAMFEVICSVALAGGVEEYMHIALIYDKVMKGN